MAHQKEIASFVVLRYPGRYLPQNYINFVRVKWMKSFRYGNDYMKLCDSDSYFAAYTIGITSLLSKPQTIVRMAVLGDDIDVALGFSVMRGTILDYVYVHKDQRHQAIAKHLVPMPVETITHLTKTGLKLWPTKLPNAIFNPFA